MLTRRRFVQLMGGAAAIAVAPIPLGCSSNATPPTGLFFDAHAWETIDIATGFILPGTGGARDAMAVRYIDTLLAAFTVSPPAIFGGGPYSNRNAIPDQHGAATSQFPPDNFSQFLPLSRVREIAWRMRIFGSAATTGGDFNDALLGPTVGYQTLYTSGIAALDAEAQSEMSKQFVDLAADDQSRVLDTVADANPAFYQALINHTLEGTYGAPEYGGNAKLIGWHTTRYDGDSAPLGHAAYDVALGAYVDRADAPTSSATPGDATETYDTDVINTLTVAAIGSGGMRFF